MVDKLLGEDFITQGPRIAAFEKGLCKYTGARHAVACSSGTAALHIAACAAGIGSLDEVITSPLTFLASANCILYCGGKVVFSDIEDDTGNLDVRLLSAKIGRRTKAIIPVHYAGLPCDLSAISRIARLHDIVVIEDAAHALGASYRNDKIGSCRYSDMTILSFHPVKSITTAEGGAVLTNRKDLYERLCLYRSHGITKDPFNFIGSRAGSAGPWYYEMQVLGFNYRMNDIEATLGIAQLAKLDGFIAIRRRIAKTYNEAFAGNPYFELPVERPRSVSACHLYPIRLSARCIASRKDIVISLRKAGLGAQVHYIPVYLHPYYGKLGYRKGICPQAEKFYGREISIPLYPSLRRDEIAYVIKTMLSVCKRYSG